MAAVLKYEEKDIPKFKEEMCPKCILKGQCIEEGRNNHWFLACPHYHKWKLGYISWVAELLEWQRQHPDEVEEGMVKRRKVAKELSEKSKKSNTKKKTTGD